MTQEQKEAFKAVEKINEENFCKYGADAMPILSITFADYMTFISLSIPSKMSTDIPEIHLYNSENDDRKFFEKSNKYESFYKFIKRKFIEIKEEIYSVKL